MTTPPFEIRPYGEVVTGEAHSESGLYTVHRVTDRLLYEIPASALVRIAIASRPSICGTARQ